MVELSSPPRLSCRGDGRVELPSTTTMPACASTFPNFASDYGLLVANGTYALTAGNCVECSCGPGNLDLYCTPASLGASCSSMQCSNSSLMLGNVTAQPTSGGCGVSSCSDGGLVNGSIVTSLSSGLQPTFPGPHQSPPLMEPSTAASHDSFLPPSPAPGPGEAGGAVPGSSEPGGSTNSAGSFSRAPLVQQLYPMIMILSLSFYLHM